MARSSLNNAAISALSLFLRCSCCRPTSRNTSRSGFCISSSLAELVRPGAFHGNGWSSALLKEIDACLLPILASTFGLCHSHLLSVGVFCATKAFLTVLEYLLSAVSLCCVWNGHNELSSKIFQRDVNQRRAQRRALGQNLLQWALEAEASGRQSSGGVPVSPIDSQNVPVRGAGAPERWQMNTRKASPNVPSWV